MALTPLRSFRSAPLARATNYATAKAPLDFGLVGPSLWTSTAAWLYCTNLVSFAQGVCRQPCLDSNFSVTGVYPAISCLEKRAESHILEGELIFVLLALEGMFTFFYRFVI